MSEKTITIVCKEPVGECQFCEFSNIHASGYGYICSNSDGKLYGKHITTWYRGVDTKCKCWKLFGEKGMKYKELYKRAMKAWEWDSCDCIERFLEWCEEEGIEIKEGEA